MSIWGRGEELELARLNDTVELTDYQSARDAMQGAVALRGLEQGERRDKKLE